MKHTEYSTVTTNKRVVHICNPQKFGKQTTCNSITDHNNTVTALRFWEAIIHKSTTNKPLFCQGAHVGGQ